jgi:hypothetical protein
MVLPISIYGLNAVWWNSRAIVVILNITLALSLAFSKNFLRTNKYNPRLNKVLTLYMSLMLLMAVLSFYFPYRVMIVIALLSSAGTAFLVITTGIFNWRAGNRAARFFCVFMDAISGNGDFVCDEPIKCYS